MKPLNIVIGVPTFRGVVSSHTMISLMRVSDLFHKAGINMRLVKVDSADIVTTRNMIGTLCYMNEDFTHLLFIDDDMSFEADAIMTLLRADKDIVGCVCPKRTLDMKAFHTAALTGAPYEQCMAEALSFVTMHLPTEKLHVDNGLCKLAGIGMAVTLIKRSVLVKMVDMGVVLERAVAAGGDALGNPKFWGFFEQIYYKETDSLLSEDLSFCTRWREQCGGEVYGAVGHEIGHIGQYVYSGRYLDLLRAGKG
jgi:hypothetical protein